MSFIQVNMFSTPVVKMQEKELVFPYSKAQAVFFFLLANKRTTRAYLSSILWSDDKSDVARKNLRNALYKIKKLFSKEIILSPDKSTLLINPEIDINCDLFYFENFDDELINKYKDGFLKGFVVKNAPEFEKWLDKKRLEYKKIYIQKLYYLLEKTDVKDKNTELYSSMILHENPLDENAARYLIEFYLKNQNYKSAIEVYKRLEKELKKINITPDIRTKKLLDENISNNDDTFFFGRENQIGALEKNLENFLLEKNSKSILITGEAGIGKTSLKDKFIQNISKKDLNIMQSICYISEKEFYLKPWFSILSQLMNISKNQKAEIEPFYKKIIQSLIPASFKNTKNLSEMSISLKYDLITELLINSLKSIAKNKKIIIVFEDIQYMDSMSLSLLNSIILPLKSKVCFILTLRKEYYENIDSFITNMKLSKAIYIIKLERFSKKESIEFMKAALNNIKLSSSIQDNIYKETEGNTFFLSQYAISLKEGKDPSLNPKMQDIIKSKFINLTKDEKYIVNICSVFADEIYLETLIKITDFSPLKMLDIIESLENKNILKECKNENTITYIFTHQKLKEFIYTNLSNARKSLIHNMIIKEIDKKIKDDDIQLFYKMVYHLSSVGDLKKLLYYRLKILNYYLDFSHELFPILNQAGIISRTYFSEKETLEAFEEIQNLINISKIQENDKMYISYLHMKGRYLIRQGNYTKGLKIIHSMIDIAKSENLNYFIIEGYKQIIFYSIQNFDTVKMKNAIKNIKPLLDENNDKIQYAIILRFEGLYNIMVRNFDKAEKLLLKSIDIFSNNDKLMNVYSLNIAAAYNYIGEIRRFNMNFKEAIYYYDKAVEISKVKQAVISLAVFNINAGEVAFDMGNISLSKTYFEKGYALYENFDSIWRKSVAEAFFALIKNQEKDYKIGLRFLKLADKHSKQIKNPHEIGIVYRVKAEIVSQFNENKSIKDVYESYLKKDLSYYKDQGIKFLEISGDKCEIDIINNL